MPEEKWGRCITTTHFTCDELLRIGKRAVIQAGSLEWLRIKPEEDDGVSSTHFGYVWEPDTVASRVMTALGGVPEIHVWVGLLDTQEIVDLSTKYLPAAALSVAGLDWPGEAPPDYLWGSELPRHVHYTVNREASLYASAKILKAYDPWYLQSGKEMLSIVQQQWQMFPLAGMESASG